MQDHHRLHRLEDLFEGLWEAITRRNVARAPSCLLMCPDMLFLWAF